ncbi:MAG: hypothetical protein JWQ11_2747 [Rhizobacter sp.]|nr:hypothetical protein [Rhizobacter sp.]
MPVTDQTALQAIRALGTGLAYVHAQEGSAAIADARTINQSLIALDAELKNNKPVRVQLTKAEIEANLWSKLRSNGVRVELADLIEICDELGVLCKQPRVGAE